MGVGIWPNGRISGGTPYKNDPDPQKFKLLVTVAIGKYLIVKIKYPNCSNYEGVKILLLENVTEQALKSMTYLDPHFSNDSAKISPIARFEPTDRGLTMAILLAKRLEIDEHLL